MGGLNSEVYDDTRDVLLESAYFLPTNIRRTSKRMGLRTEASYRFERGTDIVGLLRALDRAAELIAELAEGTVAQGIWDAYPTVQEPRRILLRFSKVSAVLGVEVAPAEIVRYFESLGLRTLQQDGAGVEVEIPTHRVDLEREIDLIEEVARLKGFDAIPATLPTVPMSCEEAPPFLPLADRARDVLASLGLREAISLSFVDPADDDRLGVSAGDHLRKKIGLTNPLSRETAVLRTSLLPGLLRAAGLNVRRQARDVRLFEVGRTYHPVDGAKLPREVLRAAAVLTGRRSPLSWSADAVPVDFYDVKGIAEELLRRLGVDAPRFEPAANLPWLHPGRAARIFLGDVELGWVGQLLPERSEAYDIPVNVVGFELNLVGASAVAAEAGHFRGLERYPAVERDMALLVRRSVTAASILEAVASVDSPLVRSADLFDAFEGGKLPEGVVSLAVRVTYRSEERTLTEQDVAGVEKQILAALAERVGARLRDT